MDPATILAEVGAALQLAKLGFDIYAAMQQSGASQTTEEQAAALAASRVTLATAQAAAAKQFGS